MKIVRVYFKINNFDKIHIFWNIAPIDGEVKTGTETITLPYVDLPYIQNAHYSVEYYAENEYGKTETYTYEFDIISKEEYITTVNVEVSNTKESATISWNKVTNITEYILHIYHNATDTTVTIHDTQYLFKPAEDGNYSFAVEVNGIISEKTDDYYLYRKPIFGTNQNPNAPSLNANYTYNRITRTAEITITLTHSDSEDVVGTYLSIGKSGGAKEVLYLPADSPAEIETIAKQYTITEETDYIIEAYSVNIDGFTSDITTFNLNITPDTNNPPYPSNIQLDKSYDSNLQASIIDISFDAVSWELPVEYEIAYSLDGLNWNYITTTENKARIAFSYGEVTVYIKVRTKDSHGNVSSWTTPQSIITSPDTTPPAVPTGLTATGLFQTIMVKWDANTEIDFKHYVLQYDTVDTFDNDPKQIVLNATSTVIKDLNVNTTYYLRIKAVDLSGNESDWSNFVSASTVKIDDESYYDYAAIKDAIIHNGYIDSAWISELDAGLITTGYLDADRIAAGSITGDKIASNSITTEKIIVRPNAGLPEGAIAYFRNNLIDEISGLKPEGYEYANIIDEVYIGAGQILTGTLTAGNYIQIGTEEAGWRIDADNGLMRLFQNYKIPLVGIVESNIVQLAGETETTITLPYPLEKYTVLLNMIEYNIATGGDVMVLTWQDISDSPTETKFKIFAYIKDYHSPVNVGNYVTLEEKDTTYTIYDPGANTMDGIKIEFYVPGYNDNNRIGVYHTYTSPSSNPITARFSVTLLGCGCDYPYPWSYKTTIYWGDGTSTTICSGCWSDFDNIVVSRINYYIPGTTKLSANATVQYTVIGY